MTVSERYLMRGLLTLLSVGLLALTACAPTQQASLPLAEGKPTLLFFYTDN